MLKTHTLIEIGGAALAAAVPYPGKATRIFLPVCPGLPVESEERCVCVWQLNVDGCIWIGRTGQEKGTRVG